MSVRVWAAKALVRVEKEGAYSNVVVDGLLERYNPKPEDRRLLMELVYGVLRHQRYLDYILNQVSKYPMDTLDLPIVQVFRLSLYQLLFLDRIPAHAVLNESGRVLRALKRARAVGLGNAILREIQRRTKSGWNPLDELEPFPRLAIEHSVPDWLLTRWDDELKAEGLDEATRFHRLTVRAETMNTAPALALWTNRQKTTVDELQERLAQQKVKAHRGDCLADALVMSPRNLDKVLPLFKEGLCHVMDESAQCVLSLCRVQAGMRVLDLCAAPGGKTLALASLVGPEGEVLAVDLHENRLRSLNKSLARFDFPQVKTLAADAKKPLPKVEEASFDVVLIDAPCSALGVVRRHPEIKWKRSEKDLSALAWTQAELLQQASRYVKPGGVLVYAVCTDTEEETRQRQREAETQLGGFSLCGMPVDIPKSLWHHSALLSRDVPTADTHFAFALRRNP